MGLRWPFSSYKAVIWQLYVVYAYLSHKKGFVKNIIFWAFCKHNKNKIRVQFPYMGNGHTYIAHNSVIFSPIPIFLYRDAHEIIIYQLCYFLGAKLNLAPGDPSPKIPPLGGFFLVNPNLPPLKGLNMGQSQ